MERRLSTTSESSNDSRQSCSDAGDGVQGRVPKVMSPKVATNPLQFVKVAPCGLYRSAQAQLKKVEEIKKVKKVCRDEGEDWQSNLDNWKCSRRKRQEHIIERVVEVKKFELEEHERNRKKSKTFNEMMQDRTIKGRKTSLPIYHDDDANDLSDLGLSNSKSSDKTDAENGNETSESSNDIPEENEKKEKSPEKSEKCEHYTYEWAIQSYVNFTESRVKSKSTNAINDDKKKYPPIPVKPKSTAKVENYLKTVEMSNQNNSTKTPVLPKVNVNKQKEIFEKRQDDEKSNKIDKTEIAKSPSIKERMSSFGKQQESPEKEKVISEPLVKSRLMNIESVSAPSPPKKSIEPISISIKDRLSSLSKTEMASKKSIIEPTLSLKDRMNSLQSSINKEIPKQSLNISSPNVADKIKENETKIEEERSYSPEDMSKKHFRHRSLDSLDIDSDNAASFERVQSLEDLDYRNYPPSTFSGDTDREDSGIHTADVSSSVSQADDYDLHLDSDDIKMNHQPPIVEEKSKFFEEHVSVPEGGQEDSNISNLSLPQPDSNLNKVDFSENSEAINTLEETLSPNTALNTSELLNSHENQTDHLDFEEKDEIKKEFETQPIENGLSEKSEIHNFSQPTDELIMKEIISPVEENQYKGIVMDVYSETQQECIFNLNPVQMEPPKEKPPPPPVDVSDDEDMPPPKTSLRRLDSTKRIKKEIRQKRSSFLGIEANGDAYLDPEIELVRPPDISTFLAEERRIDRQLFRQSVCSESDSNQESRDSGVELDHKLPDTWSHSRNDSELYGNQSTTSEEDEIMKKEREIIETLEQEEKIRKQDLGEKLAMRLRELEAEKERVNWDGQNSEPKNYHNGISYKEENSPVINEPVILREKVRHERTYPEVKQTPRNDWYEPRIPKEAPPVARRPEYIDDNYHLHCRKSLQDLSRVMPNQMVPVTYDYVAHRRSMPNLQEVARRQPPPPPVLPEKPHHFHSNMSTSSNESGSQQMTRQTLHALSAAPRSKLISNDTWQAKRKQQRPDNYNYQHWLIQEAEHRRITEQQQRQNGPVRNGPAQHPCRNLQKYPNGQYYPEQRQQPPPHHAYNNQRIPQSPQRNNKPLPDAIIQTLTQRVQRMNSDNNNNRRRIEMQNQEAHYLSQKNDNNKDKMLSVSGKKRCSHCGEELGRGAAMIIESLQLFYHIDCFKCCVCCLQLGDGLMGTDVRVRNNKLHCHNCYSSDDGAKFSCV